MPTIAQQTLNFQILRNLRVPKEGPKSAPVQLQFATLASTHIDLDLLNMEQLNKLSMVQAFYIDNSQNGSSLTITVPTSQFRVVIPPQTEAFMPALVPNPIKMSFDSAGNIDDIFVHLLNFPVTSLMWKTT